MTPEETSPSPVDEQLLAEMMAFDALLHASATAKEGDAGNPPSPDEVDDRGRSRLLLLLKMLEATEASAGAPADAGVAPGREAPRRFVRCWAASTSSTTWARAGSDSWSAPATACWAARWP